MAEKDIISKHILKRIALDMAIYLFKLEITDAELLDTEFQRVEDRRADLLLQVKAPEHYLLHIEVQNDNQAQMPLRMLRYFTDIAFAYPKQIIRQYVIYIGREPLRMKNRLIMPDWRFYYHLLDMREMDCASFLRQDNPDALVLSILCDFKGQDPHAVIRHILNRLQVLLGEDQQALRNYLGMLEILSGNRALQEIVYEEEAMLSSIKLSDLPSYRHGQKEGLAEGLEKGLQKGLRNGMAEMLLALLEDKFGALPKPVRQRIARADVQRLKTWNGRLLKASSLDEIFTE